MPVTAVTLQQLPVSALPQVDYPTIQVQTFYPGAGPDVMASSVTAPLERQFGQVPGLTQMTSSSSEGLSVITLQFSLDLNSDIAEQEVQASINAAGTFLPRDLPNPPVYSKTNPADAPILTLALTSKTLPLAKVEDLADTRLSQKIAQLQGAGLVTISGGQKLAVRIQVNPTALASRGLSMEDVRSAIAAANVNQAKGSFADVDAHGVFASAATQAAGRTGAAVQDVRECVSVDRGSVWATAASGTGPSGLTLIVAVGTLVLTVVLFLAIPKGFFPVQDTGVILGISEGPQDISFDAMADRQQRVVDAILQDPAVEGLSSFIGIDGTNVTLNSGRIQINLKE